MNVPAGAGSVQPRLLYGGALASTTGNGDAMPVVMLEPVSMAVAPPLPVSVTVDWKARSWVEAATED